MSSKIKIEKMDGKSKDVWQEKLEAIKKQFPEILSENKVDCEKLKKLVGKENIAAGERYNFTWAGKSDAIQEIKRRTTATLKPDYNESEDFEDTENIFIEGENLEVLRILQKSYYGKVKMIYIDPPYNTGNDFVYNDKFAETREEYEEKTGDVDEEGKKIRALQKNTKESGHYHSNWLNMMYPRLYLARNLLREDGVIFISIDDNEVHNLRMIMNEIFGEENTLDRGVLIWENKGSTKGFNKIVKNHEYILAYAKDSEKVKSVYGNNFPKKLGEIEHYCYNAPNPGNPPCEILFKAGCKIRGIENIIFHNTVGDKVNLKIVSDKMEFKNGELVKDVVLKGAFPYRYQIEKFFHNQKNGKPTYDNKGQKWKEIFFNSKGLPRYRKSRGTKIISSIIDDKNIPHYGAEEIKVLFNRKEIFSFPKPKELISHLLKYFVTDDDLVLDYFAGSGTTAQSVMNINCIASKKIKYILVQYDEVAKEDSYAKKAGYETIADIAKERIRRAAKKIKKEKEEKLDFEGNDLDLGFKVFKLSNSNFKTWRRETIYSKEELQQKLQDSVQNVKEDAKKVNMLYELMLKLGADPNTEITNKDNYYIVGEGEIAICLEEEITKQIVESILEEEPNVVVCLDVSFKGDDELKTNTALQMKAKNIEFKVV